MLNNSNIIDPPLSKQHFLHHVDCLLQSKPNAGLNKPHVDALGDFLAAICEISVDTDMNRLSDIRTERGVAISPVQAAKCLQEVLRTQIFMQGIAQALEERLNETETTEILYAGTGPYGLLILPYLALHPQANIRLTLIDIHPENINAVERFINYFNLWHCVDAMEVANATQWRPESGQSYDLIISETMNTLLRREPQVWIFSHLQKFLKQSGDLIPQSINLHACLSKASIERKRMEGLAGEEMPLDLGAFFTLNKKVAQELGEGREEALSGEISLPSMCEHYDCIKFLTHIQIYKNHQLNENQCSLNIPVSHHGLCLIPGSKIGFKYKKKPFPEFVFDIPQQFKNTELPKFSETGSLGIFQLKRAWVKAQKNKLVGSSGSDENLAKEWNLDVMLFDELGLGLELAIQALYQHRRFEDFEHWVLEQNDQQFPEDLIKRLNRNVEAFYSGSIGSTSTTTQQATKYWAPISQTVLGQEDYDFWLENGYLVLPGFVNKTLCKNACQAIYEFMQAKPEDRASWYTAAHKMQQIMVPLFRHPALQAIRNLPKIRQVFECLWGNDYLWMSTDRVSFNPPENEQWQFPGPNMHWDVELKSPIPFATQGLVYLSDTEAHQGAFRCVPGFHKKIDDWLEKLPVGSDPQQQDWSLWNAKPIAAEAGSLIIWHQALPHGSGPNLADNPRIVQYLNMRPVVHYD